jgi:hypothetical protein
VVSISSICLVAPPHVDKILKVLRQRLPIRPARTIRAHCDADCCNKVEMSLALQS